MTSMALNSLIVPFPPQGEGQAVSGLTPQSQLKPGTWASPRTAGTLPQIFHSGSGLLEEVWQNLPTYQALY